MNFIASTDVGVQEDVARFRESRDECVELNGALSLYLLGLQGGYYEVPAEAFELEGFKAVYLVDKGESKLLSLNEIKDEYYSMLRERIKSCVVYPANLDVVEDSYTSDVEFGADTRLSVNYDMKVV